MKLLRTALASSALLNALKAQEQADKLMSHALNFPDEAPIKEMNRALEVANNAQDQATMLRRKAIERVEGRVS